MLTNKPYDDEGDISDNPFLSAINADLVAANQRGDRLLLIVLVLLAALAYLYKRSGGASIWLNALLAALVIGSIVYTFWRAQRQSHQVAAKYGLVCKACGHAPKAHMILSTATTLRCAKCKASLKP
jgi:hypothetical protein